MYCQECGKQNSDKAKFCFNCGSSLIILGEQMNNDTILKQNEPAIEKNKEDQNDCFVGINIDVGDTIVIDVNTTLGKQKKKLLLSKKEKFISNKILSKKYMLNHKEIYETLYKYDSKGRLITEKENGKYERTYKYDSDNRLIQTHRRELSPKYAPTVPKEENYEYDSSGNLIYIQSFFIDTEVDEKKFHYDNDNNKDGMIEEHFLYNEETEEWDSDWKLGIKYDFDEEGNMVHFKRSDRLLEDGRIYAGSREVPLEEWLEYDTFGKLIHKIDEFDNETTYEYDNIGKLKNITEIIDGEERYTSYLYDNKGNIIYENCSGQEKWIMYKYNEIGEIIEKNYFKED